MDSVKAKDNYSRVCQLLVDKRGDAFAALPMKHPPSTFYAVLNANKSVLQKIRYSVKNTSQWNLLFPVSGKPDTETFDVTLSTILLRNIRGLHSPATGWNVMPPISDTSISANIARIKIFRKEVYGHRPSAQLEDTAFQTLWQKISNPLVKLRIPQQDIDELKEAPLSPEEESYVEKLKDRKELKDIVWSNLDDGENKVKKVQNEVSAIREVVETLEPLETNQLARFDFTPSLQLRLYDDPNVWLFNKFPGIGKSVMSGKQFELYKQCGQIAAHHFCDSRISDSRNGHEMFDNVNEFCHEITEVLHLEHSQKSLFNAFRVLLKELLNALDREEPMLIVVNAFDKSNTNVKSLFLELISDLPAWIKITTAPELWVRKKLSQLNPFEIVDGNTQHNFDSARFPRHGDKPSDILCYERSRDSVSDEFQWQFIESGTSRQNIDGLRVNATPSFKKSFFCAKVYEMYMCQKSGQHTPTDFYDRHLGWENTKRTFQSRTNQMFDNMEGRRDTLCDGLFREYSRESLSDHFPVLSNHLLYALGGRDTLVIVVDAKSKAKTKANAFSSSDEDPVCQQRCKNKKDKKPKRKNFADFNARSIEKGKQKKRIRGHIGYSSAKKKMIMKHEKMSEEHALKARNSPHLMKPLDVMKCPRVKELEDENFSLKKQLKSLQLKYEEMCSKLEKTAKENKEKEVEHSRQIIQIVKKLEDKNLSLKKEVKSFQLKNEELLIDLGQITVEKTARENGERKSERFHQIFHTSLQGDKGPGTSNSRNHRSNNDIYQQSSDRNSFSRPPVTNRSFNPQMMNASVVSPASSSGHSVNGVKTFVRKGNYLGDNEEEFTNNKIERLFHERSDETASTVRVNVDQQMATTQNTPSIQSGEQSSGGEETNQPRDNHDQASTSQDGYGDLSFSVQQHDSGREPISLGNIPPTSVATTLYNNYKFLLLSLAQNLLSSDVVMLQDWAAQNFSINNPRNPTDILFELDQKGVINASDLHQLSDFFESIIRIDLVYIIDAFLLGDYNLLRQRQAAKKRTENLVQSQEKRAILRNPGFLSAVSTRQFSIHTNRNLGTPRKPANNEAQKSLPQTQPQSLRNFSDTSNSKEFVRSLINQPTASTQSTPDNPATGFDSVRMAEVAVGDGPVTSKCSSTVLYYND